MASAGHPKDCAETAPLAAGHVVDVVYLLILIIQLLLILLAKVLLKLHLLEFLHILVELELFDKHVLRTQIFGKQGLLAILHD